MKRRDLLKVAGVGCITGNAIAGSALSQDGATPYVDTLRNSRGTSIKAKNIIETRRGVLADYIEDNGQESFILHRPEFSEAETVHAYNVVVSETGTVREQVFKVHNENNVENAKPTKTNGASQKNRVEMHNRANKKLEDAVQEAQTDVDSSTQSSGTRDYDWDEWNEDLIYDGTIKYKKGGWHVPDYGDVNATVRFAEHPTDDFYASRMNVHSEPGHNRCHAEPTDPNYCSPVFANEYKHKRLQYFTDWRPRANGEGSLKDVWPRGPLSSGETSTSVSLEASREGFGVAYDTEYSKKDANIRDESSVTENFQNIRVDINDPRANAATDPVWIEPGSVCEVRPFACGPDKDTIDIAEAQYVIMYDINLNSSAVIFDPAEAFWANLDITREENWKFFEVCGPI